MASSVKFKLPPAFRKNKRLVTVVLSLLAAGIAGFSSQADFGVEADVARAPGCDTYFFDGFRPVLGEGHRTKLKDLCFDDFAILYSGESKTPVYSAEHITPASLKRAKAVKRVDRFYEEARVPQAYRATLKDYKGSGYDRGHLAAAAQRSTVEGMAQSFSLTNIVPQAPLHNQNAWAKNVEKVTLDYARRSSQGVYVFTGPIYSGQVQWMGPGNVWVPTSMFKLVYDPAKKKAWAFDLANENSAQVKGTISYTELVARTGIEFLPAGAVLPETK